MFAWLQRLARWRPPVGPWKTEGAGAAKDALGRRGEALAARLLRRRGMRILERNLVSGRYEIDIVAGDGETLVFVEVKTRRSDAFAPPERAVNAAKQRHIRAAAQGYVRRWRLARGAAPIPIRFDVVAIEWPSDGRKPVARHIRNAFDR